MRRNLRLVIALIFLTINLTAQAECKNAQIEHAILQRPSGGAVEAVACSTSETTGDVTVTFLLNGNRMAAERTTYESDAYVLSIDTTNRFGKTNEQGVGVSTGRDRDGNGMHYWKIADNGMRLIDLGEAPILTRDRHFKETYSALASSSGDYQSVRYFYEIRDNAFVAVKAIGFSTPNPNQFLATSMLFGKDGHVIIVRKRRLLLANGISCMNGNIKCW